MTPATSDSTPTSNPLPIPKDSNVDGTTPFLNLDRDQLFSPDIARANGLDPDTFAILEIPNGSSYLYKTILFYASHYAIDLNSSIDAPAECPDLSEKEINSENDSATPLAPPVTQDRSVKKKKGSTEVATKPKNYVRGCNGTAIQRREGPGRLSTLWNCPRDLGESMDLSDEDCISGSDSDSSSENGDDDAGFSSVLDNIMEASGRSGSLRAFASLGALKKKVAPPLQRYQMGVGYAKIELDGHTVFLHHCAYGLPVPESYTIRVFRTLVLAGEDDFQLKQLCAVALKWRADRDARNQRAAPGKFTLFRFKTGSIGPCGWSNEGYKKSRPAKSIILPEGQLESIVNDIKEFVSHDTKNWYEAHGLPHRRSFLFHGPPGCGKTSTIKMISGMFRLNACFLSLTGSDFSNQSLQDALSTLPRRALLVLEDVDVLFNEDRKSEASQSLTFSGLLNALDGLISVDGILTIFTTNHIEKLDPALIRGGRVDRRFEFNHPSAKQTVVLFKSFYENASDQLAKRFADMVLSRPEDEARSIATLQQHFIYTRKMTAEESVDMIPKFFAEFYPKGGRTRNSLYV